MSENPVILIENFTEICPQWFKWQQTNIGSGNDFVSNKPRVILYYELKNARHANGWGTSNTNKENMTSLFRHHSIMFCAKHGECWNALNNGIKMNGNLFVAPVN